jgi:ribosome modulation factor
MNTLKAQRHGYQAGLINLSTEACCYPENDDNRVAWFRGYRLGRVARWQSDNRFMLTTGSFLATHADDRAAIGIATSNVISLDIPDYGRGQF